MVKCYICGNDVNIARLEICPNCIGSGLDITGDICPQCWGEGKIYEELQLCSACIENIGEDNEI